MENAIQQVSPYGPATQAGSQAQQIVQAYVVQTDLITHAHHATAEAMKNIVTYNAENVAGAVVQLNEIARLMEATGHSCPELVAYIASAKSALISEGQSALIRSLAEICRREGAKNHGE